jgi:FkbM family methyltransferase
VADGYDLLLLRNDTLTSSSTFVEFGGYHGEFAQELFKKYSLNMYIFEPVPEFMEELKIRFSGNKKVKLYEFGIAEHDTKRTFHLSDVSTGEYAEGERIEVTFKNCKEVFEKLPSEIDLGMLNIEGGEYELIKLLKTTGDLLKFKILLIQFHYVGWYSLLQYMSIKLILKKNFKIDWSYPFVWEKWIRQSDE